MRIFIESIDCGIWDAIVNGPYMPQVFFDNQYVDKPWRDLIDIESKKSQYNNITKNIITSLLNFDVNFSKSHSVHKLKRCRTP